MSDPILVTSEGNTGIIELARPEKFNCLSLEVHERISVARAESRRTRISGRSSSGRRASTFAPAPIWWK